MHKGTPQKSIKNFEDLDIWKRSQDLAVFVYETTNSFPSKEQFGITNQIRRAASSISANIAEGFGRSSKKEKVQFYSIAYGSLLETKNFLYLSERLGFLDKEKLENLLADCIIIQKQINTIKTRLSNEQKK